MTFLQGLCLSCLVFYITRRQVYSNTSAKVGKGARFEARLWWQVHFIVTQCYWGAAVRQNNAKQEENTELFITCCQDPLLITLKVIHQNSRGADLFSSAWNVSSWGVRGRLLSGCLSMMKLRSGENMTIQGRSVFWHLTAESDQD